MLIVTLLEALELGLIYSILALGVFLSFRTLNTPDLTVDGSIVTGAAISAVVCTAAADLDPAVQGVVCILGLVLSFLFGMGAGAITALLNTKLKIQPLLAGILVMLGIYSINLRIQGKANINLSSRKTIYSMMDDAMGGFRWSAIVLGVLIAAVVIILMYGFLKTRLGFALRATGDNEDMVRAAGISSDRMKLLGLSVSNGLVGLAGGMLAQYQGYSDVGMGTGMVVIGLASLIIGETLFGRGGMWVKAVAAVAGSVIYRFIIALALRANVPSECLKLISAIIVALAIAAPALRAKAAFRRRRAHAGKEAARHA